MDPKNSSPSSRCQRYQRQPCENAVAEAQTRLAASLREHSCIHNYYDGVGPSHPVESQACGREDCGKPAHTLRRSTRTTRALHMRQSSSARTATGEKTFKNRIVFRNGMRQRCNNTGRVKMATAASKVKSALLAKERRSWCTPLQWLRANQGSLACGVMPDRQIDRCDRWRLRGRERR